MTEFQHPWAAPATFAGIIRGPSTALADAELVVADGRVLKDRYGIAEGVLKLIKDATSA